MKRLLVALFVFVTLIAGADQAIQQDQNYGFLSFATATFDIAPASFTDLMSVAPTTVASWVVANPAGQFIVLPARCKGFLLNVFDGDAIVGDATNCATGTYFVGVKIASGSSLKWESRSPDQSKVNFRIRMNGTTTGRVTISGWGQ